MLEARKSPLITKKLVNQSLLQKDKNLSHNQSHAISYQINRHYVQQTKSTSVAKIMSTSRNTQNQQSNEDSQYFQTKTIQINLNQLAHSSSQNSLTQGINAAKTARGDDDEVNHTRRQQQSQLDKSRIQTARNRKSPSPQKIVYNLDPKRQYQSILNENAPSTKSQAYKNKKSIDSKLSSSRLSNKFGNTKKESSQNPQQAFRTTVSAVTAAQNLKSRTNHQSQQQNQHHQLQQQMNHQKISMNTYKPSGLQQANAGLMLNNNIQSFEASSQRSSKLPITIQIEKNRKSKRQLAENQMISPAIISQQSPRLTLGAGSTTGATSVYSITTDSIVNSSTYHQSNQRKMCLSEKIAPKGKKKRANAHKQPKQITITRDQIILQPFLSIYSTQNGGLVVQNDISRYQVDTNPQNQSIQSSVQVQLVNTLNHIDSTPNTNYNDLGDDQDFLNQFNRQASNKDLMELQRKGSDMFSFQMTNGKSQKGKNSFVEESKEITGIFGQQTLESQGNEPISRPSLDNQHERKKTVEIPTPVFQAATRSQSGFKQNDVVLHLDVKLCDDSPQQQLNHEQTSLRIKHQNLHNRVGSMIEERILQPSEEQKLKELKEMQTEYQDQERHSDLSSNFNHEQSLKKVYSASDLNMSRGNQSAQTATLNRNDSNSSFFSRLKNYFGGKPQSEVIDVNKPLNEFRCKCGPSGKTYACKRALRWLQFCNNYSEMEYEKNKQLYQGLMNFNTASGSESQIERDIPRTFPNSDPYMNTTEGQQKLSRVLNGFSKYFTSIGYVQGMNFIVGALLIHCSEDIAFWLFVSLIEDYEMRDIYQPKLPGLYKHSQVLQLLQMEHLQRLYYHFSAQNILIEMYASDWIFALFSNIIPIGEYHHFLDRFFVGGWTFFYKFSLTFLKCHQEEVIQLYDLSEILNMVKLKNVKKDAMLENKSPRIRFDESGQISELESMKRYSDTSSLSPTRQTGQVSRMGNLFSRIMGKESQITSESFKDDAVWERVVNLSCQEWENEFNENFVNQLLSSFDPDKLVFNSSTQNTPKEVSIVYSAKKKSSRVNLHSQIEDTSHLPHQSFNNDSRKLQQDTSKLSKQKKSIPTGNTKLQIIVNDNTMRNPRSNNFMFAEQNSRLSIQSKQTRSQQPRDSKKQQVPKR